ncbi:hypothetical protein ACHAW6_010738 [Cyclotella cf. meneghiniana]
MNMPTIHYITLSDAEKAGIPLTLMEQRYAREIVEETGIPPTRDQILEYIQKKLPGECLSENVSHEKKGSVCSSLLSKNPIFVKNGNKQELHDAWELIGPDVEKRSGYVWIEWGISGLKEFVLESDVVRGELPSRTRRKTDRYADGNEEENKQSVPKKPKLSYPPAVNSLSFPIKDSDDTRYNDAEGSSPARGD